MKKFSLLFLFGIIFYPTKAQNAKEQQQLKTVILQAYESVSQSARQWFADASQQNSVRAFDSAWTKNKLKERFRMDQLITGGEIIACMFEFQKMLNNEAREDREMGDQARHLLRQARKKN